MINTYRNGEGLIVGDVVFFFYGKWFDEGDGAGGVVDLEESLIGRIVGHQSVRQSRVFVQIDVVGGDAHHELVDGHVTWYRRFVRHLQRHISITLHYITLHYITLHSKLLYYTNYTTKILQINLKKLHNY